MLSFGVQPSFMKTEKNNIKTSQIRAISRWVVSSKRESAVKAGTSSVLRAGKPESCQDHEP